MAAPTVAHTFAWASSASGVLPADVQAGDVLILNVTANESPINTLAVHKSGGGSDWLVLSPLLLTKPGGFAGSTSFPGVIAYRDADGTEGGTTIKLDVNGTTFADVAVSGLVVRGAGPIPVLHGDTGPYPWYEATTGTTGHALVPAVANAADTLQLITANGQQQGGTSPVYTFDNGFTNQVEVNRWFPSCGWGAQGFGPAGPGAACHVVQTNTGGADPDPYCWLVTFTAASGLWHIGTVRAR